MNNQPVGSVEGLLSFADELKRGMEEKRSYASVLRLRAGDLQEQSQGLEREAGEDESCEKRHRLVAVLVRGISPALCRAMRQRRDREVVEPAAYCPHPVVLEYRFAGRQCLICQRMESSVNGTPFPNLGDSRERYIHQRWDLDRPMKPVSWPRLIAWLTDDDNQVLQIFKDTGLTVTMPDE